MSDAPRTNVTYVETKDGKIVPYIVPAKAVEVNPLPAKPEEE